MGQAPNAQYDYGKVMMLILKGDPPSLPDGPWSDQLRSFICACLKKIPDDRPSLDQLVKDHQDFLGMA